MMVFEHGVEPICRQLPIAPSVCYENKAREVDPARLPLRAISPSSHDDGSEVQYSPSVKVRTPQADANPRRLFL